MSRGDPVPVVRSQVGSDGMGDHEHAGAGQSLLGQRRVGVDLHHEVALCQRGGGAGVRRVARVRGLHLAREVGPDGPCLAVGLVEDDTGEHSGFGHGHRLLGAPAVVDAEIDVISAIDRRMDPQDRQIIALLVEDGRRTYDDIGQRVSLSAPAVKRRVDRLRASGALRGFTAVVDHNALGDHTEALIELFYAPGTLLDAVTDTLRRHPEVVEAWSVTGEADAIARVRTQNNTDLERLIMDLQRDGHVVRTRSQVVMSRLVSRAGSLHLGPRKRGIRGAWTAGRPCPPGGSQPPPAPAGTPRGTAPGTPRSGPSPITLTDSCQGLIQSRQCATSWRPPATASSSMTAGWGPRSSSST